MSRRETIPLWCWWIVLVLAISFPWKGLVPKAQWDRVHVVPFSDPADRPRDLLANVALFLPFGFSFAGGRNRSHPVMGAMAIAAVVSVSAETTQLFSTTRFPSATDVSAALLGAFLGALWRVRPAARAFRRVEG